MPDDLRYIVRRFNWRFLQQTAEGVRYVRLPGASAVAEFDSLDDAKDYCWEQEQAVRRRVNPFRCGTDLGSMTGLPAFAFKDYLLDDDVMPAKGNSFAQVRWDQWWDKNAPGWSEDRRQRIWEALGKVRFFEVFDRPVTGTLTVAVEPILERGDGRGYGDTFVQSEGGRPRRGFTSREDAQAYSELLDDNLYVDDRDWESRPRHPEYPFVDPSSKSTEGWSAIHQVPMDGTLADRALVVCRAAVRITPATDQRAPMGVLAGMQIDATTQAIRLNDWADSGFDSFGAYPTEVRIAEHRWVPELAFTDAKQAEEARERCDRAARRWLNPFLIRPPRYVFGYGQTDRLEQLAPGYPRSLEARSVWWMSRFAQAPDDLFHTAWETFNIPPLYRVIEIEVED